MTEAIALAVSPKRAMRKQGEGFLPHDRLHPETIGSTGESAR